MQSRKRLTMVLIYAALALLLVASLSACTRSLQTDSPEVTLGAQEGETTDSADAGGGESEEAATDGESDTDAAADATPIPEEGSIDDAATDDAYPAPEGEESSAGEETDDTSSPRPEDSAAEATPEPEEAAAEDTAAEETADEDAAAEDAADEESSEEATEETSEEAAPEDEAAAESDDAAADASVERIHVVAAGENLYQIGLEYGHSWVVLQQYNNLPNANSIVVGQELRIPPTEEAADDAGEEAAGPTPTPNPTDENLYTVRAGDTLDRIGKAYGISWVQIAEANGLVNPNLIKVGQVLKIPTDTPGPTPQFTHTVQPGDTLFKISLRYGVTWPAIAEANELEAPYKIFPGQELVIPASE